MSDTAKPWTQPMPDAQFKLMRDILAAPSPVGLEGAMTYGVLKPYFESFAPSDWHLHQFKGNAGVVLDTHSPGDWHKAEVQWDDDPETEVILSSFLKVISRAEN